MECKKASFPVQQAQRAGLDGGRKQKKSLDWRVEKENDSILSNVVHVLRMYRKMNIFRRDFIQPFCTANT